MPIRRLSSNPQNPPFNFDAAEFDMNEVAIMAGILPAYGTTQGPRVVTISASERGQGRSYGGGTPSDDFFAGQPAGVQNLKTRFSTSISFNAGFTQLATYDNLSDLKQAYPDSSMLFPRATGERAFTAFRATSWSRTLADAVAACECRSKCIPRNRRGTTHSQVATDVFENPEDNGSGGFFSTGNNFILECCGPCQGWWNDGDTRFDNSKSTTIATRSYSNQSQDVDTFWVAGTYENQAAFAAEREKMMMALWKKNLTGDSESDGVVEVAKWADNQTCSMCEGVG